MSSWRQARAICLAVAGTLLGVSAAGARAEPAAPPAGEQPAPQTDAATPADTEPAPGAAAGSPSLPVQPPGKDAQGEAADVYVPPAPDRLVPGGRMGGSTRGPASCPSELLALVPEDHVGLTASAQPTLYWFVGEATDCRVDFVLNDPRATTPRVERQLEGTHAAGIHALDLAEMGISLDPGVVYTWFVAFVTDRDARSKDVLSGGQIQRVDTPDAAAGGSPAIARAQALGQRGLWYDALAALQQAIVATPAAAAEQRVAASRLLDSQGLAAAAAGPGGSGVDVAGPPPPDPR